MSAHERSLIGSVIERTTRGTPSVQSSRFSSTPGAGFPPVQHRFKSAFARAREEANSKGNVGGANRTDVPSIVSEKSETKSSVTPTAPIINPKPIPTDTDALRRQIYEENARKIAHMSEDEIEREKRTILEQLGEGTGDLLRRVQEARRRKEVKEAQVELEKKAAEEVQWKDEGTGTGDNARQTIGRGGDPEPIPLIASPVPRRVSNGLATRPGVLRVKSLENIGQSGRFTLAVFLPITSLSLVTQTFSAIALACGESHASLQPDRPQVALCRGHPR